MVSVYFKDLIIEGFRSYQISTPFALDSKGLNLLKGENGAGKTSMFSALAWALFKVNLNNTVNDKVQTWKEQRLKEYRGTRVVVTYEGADGACYMVARHINFKGTTKGVKGGSSLLVYRSEDGWDFKPEDMVSDAQHKGDMQAYIDRTLGMDAKTFLNAILFGQRMARLVSAPNEEKRKLFDTLFEVGCVDTAKDKAKEEKARLSEKLQVFLTSSNAIDFSIQSLEKVITENEEILQNFENDKEERLKELESKIITAQTKIDKLENDLALCNSDLVCAVEVARWSHTSGGR